MGQLGLLVLSRGLAAGLKFFNGHAGQTQSRRQGGAAHCFLCAERFDALCHGHHDCDPS